MRFSSITSRPPRLWLGLVVLGAPKVCQGAVADTVTALYRPLQGDAIALSPDGTKIAYTRHERDELVLYVMNVQGAGPKARIPVEADREVPFARERMPARLRFLRWATANRIVLAPTETRSGLVVNAPIIAVNADGTSSRILANADDFTATVSPLAASAGATAIAMPRPTQIQGFAADDPNSLWVEARGSGAIPTSLFKLDITSAKLTELSSEMADGRFLYDRSGKPRLLYPTASQQSVRKFTVATGGAWSRWVDLEAQWGGELGKSFVVSVDNYFGSRSIPLGFDADPNILYYASNVGRDTFGVYAWNLAARQRTDLAIEQAGLDLTGPEPFFPNPSLVFDERRNRFAGVRATGVEPFVCWVDPELAAVQRQATEKFPQRSVEVLEWDDARTRFLLRVTGPMEPGRYFLFRQPENLVVELFRRAPALRSASLHESGMFAFDTPAGVRLTGQLTHPRQPRLNPPPVVIDFRATFPSRPPSGFDRDAQILAEMGFMVLRVNHRGLTGLGARHRDALLEGFDRVPVDDALAALDWLASRHSIDRKRVAALGTGIGGYLALRAIQLRPAVFRCAVAIQAPLDLDTWLQPPLPKVDLPAAEASFTRSSLPYMEKIPVVIAREAQRAFLSRATRSAESLSVLRHADAISVPVLLVNDPVADRELARQNDLLRSRLKGRGQVAEYVEVGSGFLPELPVARAKAFRQIEEFFNLNLYDYDVRLGPTREVK